MALCVEEGLLTHFNRDAYPIFLSSKVLVLLIVLVEGCMFAVFYLLDLFLAFFLYLSPSLCHNRLLFLIEAFFILALLSLLLLHCLDKLSLAFRIRHVSFGPVINLLQLVDACL